MIPLPLLKKIKLTTFSNVSDAVTAIATMAVISMDLGLPYTKSEERFYTHPLVQVIAVFCVGYQMLENISLAGILLVIWLVIKYFKHLKPHLLEKK